MPLSNTNYVNQVSARGFKFGYREMISEKVFAGVDFTNSTYTRHKPRQTYTNGTSAITTDLFNYAYSYGLTLSGDYFFKTEQRFMPYAGLGVGASYINYRQYFNVYAYQGDGWGVLVRPQAGIIYKLKDDSKWAFQAAVHYDYSSAKNEDLGLEAFNNVGLQVGIIILDW
jgi:outer membrane protein W